MLEVGHDELAQGAIDRLAKSQPSEVRLGDGAPVAMLPEDCQHVVVVAHRLEIEEQGRIALDAERRRAEESALEAMGHAITQHAARRTNRVAVRLLVVGDFGVEKSLDSLGGFERLENARLAGIEAKLGHENQRTFVLTILVYPMKASVPSGISGITENFIASSDVLA